MIENNLFWLMGLVRNPSKPSDWISFSSLGNAWAVCAITGRWGLSSRINFNASSSYTIQQVIGSVVTDLTTKNISPGNASIAINGTPSFMPGGVTYVTLNARGTSTNGSIKLIHNKRLSEATITVNIMGRVKVEYVLK